MHLHRVAVLAREDECKQVEPFPANQYKLYDVNGDFVVPSKKTEILPCWRRDGARDESGPAKFQLTCKADEVMGISAGWAEVCIGDLECQYLVSWVSIERR
ncbi:MAG TPA: hypothetical protein VGV87_13695 [Blastocatellia bacterium]|nr:hypothetical protein [Blastocatellia bacterium]